MSCIVRLARASDLAALPAIELAARARYRQEDVPEPLRKVVTDPHTLRSSQIAGLLWVAEAGADQGVVGFLAAQVLDELLHVLQVSVLPAHGKQGIGTELLATVHREAKRRRLDAVTLTTFSHVAWNAPAYLRRGFVLLSPDQLPPGLRQCLAEEQSAGLCNRVAMKKNAA